MEHEEAAAALESVLVVAQGSAEAEPEVVVVVVRQFVAGQATAADVFVYLIHAQMFVTIER